MIDFLSDQNYPLENNWWKDFKKVCRVIFGDLWWLRAKAKDMFASEY